MEQKVVGFSNVSDGGRTRLLATFGEVGNSRSLNPRIYVEQIRDRTHFHQNLP